MAEWEDDAIVLAVRPHGENGALVSLLTRSHGRHAGLVHGGSGKGARGALQPGNSIKAWWRGRLPEQLGSLKVELVQAHAARVLDDAAALAALASACALCDTALPEREPHPALYLALDAFLTALNAPSWPSVYVHWELALLRDLGYGLDLTMCAATGGVDDLAYVSPKSGRAVGREAGQPYHRKLLPLPGFLAQGGEGDRGQIFDGLNLAGFFLDRQIFAPHRRALPAARSRLVDRFRP